LSQVIQTPEQQKWAVKLQAFSFEIHYQPICPNKVADALSRCHNESSATTLSIFSPMPLLIQQLQDYYQHHKNGQELISMTQSDPGTGTEYSTQQGLFFF
jgi:hypothetical protein